MASIASLVRHLFKLINTIDNYHSLIVARTYYIRNNSHTGLLTSPNFPQHYPPNAHYLWIIIAPKPYTGIKITFTDFMVEEMGSMCKDYVVLYDGDIRNPVGTEEIVKYLLWSI